MTVVAALLGALLSLGGATALTSDTPGLASQNQLRLVQDISASTSGLDAASALVKAQKQMLSDPGALTALQLEEKNLSRASRLLSRDSASSAGIGRLAVEGLLDALGSDLQAPGPAAIPGLAALVTEPADLAVVQGILSTYPASVRSALLEVAARFVSYRDVSTDVFNSPSYLADAVRPVETTVIDVPGVQGARISLPLSQEAIDRGHPVLRAGEMSRVLENQVLLTEAMEDLTRAIKKDTLLLVNLPPISIAGVMSVDLRDFSSTYTVDYALQIDGGGNDVYQNNAGGSGIRAVSAIPFPCKVLGSAALLDTGGDDQYVSGRSCGINGGGFLGSGLLFDAGGNDQYTAGSYGTNGSGYLGSGMIIDGSGNDTYRAGGGAVNGSALGYEYLPAPVSGVLSAIDIRSSGFLLDGGGSDLYSATVGKGPFGTTVSNGSAYAYSSGSLIDLGLEADQYSGIGYDNGFATLALGFLFDQGGDDSYRTPYGGNGSGILGTGFLFDGLGSDTYQGNVFANGSSAVGAAGLLVDAEGSDIYRVPPDMLPANVGFINGEGFSAAVAMLVDGGGDDSYLGGLLSNGGGVYTARGNLIDLAGNDSYNATRLATNGGAWAGGSGFLLDLLGNDSYIATIEGVNGGTLAGALDPQRYQLPIAQGLLFDANGVDTYQDETGGTGTDCSVIPKETSGAQVDFGSTSFCGG